MTALVDQSIAHIWDKSYSIATEEHCVEDYMSLLSLQAITPQMAKDDFLHGPFKLYNPDIRLGNMIADSDYNIKAFIDWDFTTVAPAQFLYSPPLGLTPLDMLGCSDEEFEVYKLYLKIFIDVLREKDAVFSGLMEECMDNGTFWYNQAVQEAEFWQPMLQRLWKVKGRPVVPTPEDMPNFIRTKLQQYREKRNLGAKDISS